MQAATIQNKSLKEITNIGIFAASAVAIGYLLASIPNLELFTATIFLSGLVLGARAGATVGLIAALIFGVYNPWGPSPLPLLVAQVASRVLVGFVGGLLGSIDWQERPLGVQQIVFGCAGFFLTAFYSISAALSLLLPSGLSIDKLVTQIFAGIALISMATLINVCVFALVVPVVAQGLRRVQMFGVVQKET